MLRLEWLTPSELVENPRNWRTHPQPQLTALSAVISEVGWAGACLFNERTGRLIDGHARRKVALEQGTKKVPVLIGSWSEEEEAKILATLDPLAAMAEADGAKLAELLSQVQTDNPNLQAMLDELRENEVAEVLPEPGDGGDDFDVSQTGPTRAALGDLWVIGGKHRLMVGDSTDGGSVALLFEGKKPFLMVTDPPYGVNLDQSWRDEALGEKAMGPGNKNTVQNDNRSDWSETYRLFPGDVAYVWHASKFSDVVMIGLRDSGFEICQQLIWNKSVMVMGRSDYHFKHEPCWYAVRKGKTHGWIGDRTQVTVIDAASPNHIMGGSKEDRTDHPTQKPISCVSELIKNHAGDVYDPFLGSGTTLIAAHRLNRICYGCEIEPKYADVILRRAEAEGLTVKKA